MGLITRSEAAHRLKIISTQVNNSVSACREGHWAECQRAAAEAIRALEGIIPHLEEAASTETELVGSLKYGTPPATPKRNGGMGYRGSSHKPEPSAPRANKPPEPIKAPIITPPTEPEPQDPGDVVEFDLNRIAGTSEFLEQFKRGTVAPLTADELKISERFGKLSESIRERISKRFRETGKPVAMRLRQVSIKVGAHNG
jgi:hypothetical protein